MTRSTGNASQNPGGGVNQLYQEAKARVAMAMRARACNKPAG